MTVVVGFTPTAAGRAALLAAAEEASHRQMPVVVVNSSRGDALSDPSFAQPTDLEWVRSTLTDAGVSFTIRQEVRGREASDELLDVLDELNARLCVIGIRRRSAVGKMLLGSNAYRILMGAPCPVLAIKAHPDG
jgi:nucleotide-binding universal stress UspA family protein